MSKKQKPAGYPGHGKSKIMKKLWKAWGRDHQMSNEHLEAFAALVRRLPEPKYIFTPDVKAKDAAIPTPRTWHGIPYGIGKSAILLDDVKPNPAEPQPIHICSANHDLVTFWDSELDGMCGDFHILRNAAVTTGATKEILQIDELLHRVIEVRCQLDTMKKEQDQ